MYDLHLHLDGSMSPKFLLSEAHAQSVSLPATTPHELLSYLVAPPDCKNLNEYLSKFKLPLSLLQTEESIEHGVYDCLARLSAQGMTGVEIRFAPQLHLQKNLRMESIIESAISGLVMAQRDYPIRSGLLLCCMRQIDNPSLNKQTLKLAKTYLNHHILGIDLAGAETIFPTELFEDLFITAAKEDIPFTIHAGEAADYYSIQKALDFGASRIGHGVRCIENEALVDYLGNHQIPLEMCPISNVQTKAVADIHTHPILTLLRKGLLITINTDNMTVSDTSLTKELAYLTSHLAMTTAEKNALLINNKKATFL